METISCVKAVVAAAGQYGNNPSDSQLVQLQRQLDILVTVTAKGGCIAYLQPDELLTTELLSCIVNILSHTGTKSTLAQKALQLIANLEKEGPLRECLRDTFNLTACLANYLRDNLGSASDPMTIQCVKLLQRLTYGCRVPYHENYMNDLLKFVIKNVQGKETELTTHCLGLLANLCRHNVSVQAHVKNLETCRSLYKVLMMNLSHESRTIVVFALSILASLCRHEDLGEKLFNASNINQTFQLMFNILLNGEATVTRRYVVDLFKDLLQHAAIQHSLAVYEHLETCVKLVVPLLCSKDSEAVAKIFDLLLSFCAVNGVRPVIFKLLMSSSSISDPMKYKQLAGKTRQSEPFFAVVHWAAQSVQSNNGTPLLALDFLREMFEEMLDLGTITGISPRTDLVLPMLTETLMAPIDLQGCTANLQCLKIVKALQLLLVLSSEESILPQIMESTDSKLLSKVVEFQLTHNDVSNNRKIDWTESGVDVVLYTLNFMLKLKRNMPNVEKPCSNFLQDSRLVPFLAHGMTSDSRERVQNTLQLVSSGSLLDEFPSIVLGDYIAAKNASRVKTTVKQPLSSDHTAPSPKRFCYSGGEDKENRPPANSSFRSRTVSTDLDSTVQSIIDKMETGLELKDMKMSDIMGVYEHKLQSLQTKENHLQDLLETKALALAQADRLISQYRCRIAQSDAEASKLRLIVGQSEKRSEEFREQLNDMMVQREKILTKNDDLVQENARLEVVAEEHKEISQAHAEQTNRFENLQRSHTTLKQEHETMSEMHEMLRRHNETLKQQNDVATEQLNQLEDERKSLTKSLKEKESQIIDKTKSLNKSEAALKKMTKDRDELESAIDKLRDELSKTEMAKKELKHQVKSLDLVCKQHEEAISEKDNIISEQKVQISKHSQIAALIHDLSAGKNK